MHRNTNGILFLFLASVASGQEGVAPPPAEADLAALWSQSCANCHVPPDPAFAVDRAWITQLADTA